LSVLQSNESNLINAAKIGNASAVSNFLRSKNINVNFTDEVPVK
jgi:hypothetical protein